jgi:hypothetical protein
MAGLTNENLLRKVAQTSESAVSQVSKPAKFLEDGRLPI